MMCRHCHVTQVSRPRGLCWACYYTPGVRELYPSTSKFGRRGLGNFHGQTAPAAAPTAAAPGSEAKIAVLMERARLKQDLWHPADATAAGPRPALKLPPVRTVAAPELVLQAS